MCDFCTPTTNKESLRKNLTTYGMCLMQSPDNHFYLHVGRECYQLSPYINHCPICGRKLSEKQEVSHAKNIK